MSLYDRYIGPRFVNCLCSMDDIAAERERVIPLAAGVVVEIGMGPGLNLPFYNPLSVTRVVGIEPNDDFLRLGEARLRSSRIPLEIVRASAEKIPLMDKTVDTAVFTYTLCSVSDPEGALKEIRRVLKPAGRVLFLEHGLSPEADVARWQHRLNPIWRSLAVGCNLTRSVVELLDRSGFAIQDMEEFYLGGTPRVLGFHCRGVARPI